MKILILDDDLTRHEAFKKNFNHHELTHAETAEDTIQHLTNNEFDAVFLDHDLGGMTYVDSHGDIPTGYTVAKWLNENQERKPNIIYIHSMNPPGAKKMQDLLPGSILAPRLWLVEQ